MSRYDSDDRFDFSRLLDWKKAQVVQGDASGLQPDETYVLQWTVPYGAQEQAREWIYANRQGFYGPELPFMQLNGFWRTAQVRYQVVEPKNSNAGVNILQTIAKGYYTSIDWDAARILSEDSSKSNTSSADGVANTQSAVEQRFLQVRFPFIAPESVSAIVGSVSVPSPVSIRGNTYTGLNKIVEAARLEEDGSYSVLVTLSDPQYTLESYSDAGGTNEQDIVYLFNVPKENAQTIIDGWKSTNPVGASASADYNDSQKLVNIVLRRNALVKPNLTLAGINVACDTTQNFHFAWGYEKADIQAFIDAHNGPAETGSRQVQVQTRSDGLYDITIIETVVTADPPPHFTIALGVGDKITNTQKYGWNINKSQLNSIKFAYETKVAGESKTFRVTRQDDCTFDYEGSVVAQQKQEAEVSIAGEGVTTKAKTIRGATDTETGYTSGPRKRHRVDVRKEDDGTNTISVSEEEVKAGSLTWLSSGADGISSESGSFSNVDTVPTIPPSGPRVRVQPEIRVNEDGTFSGGYSKTSVKSVDKVEIGSGSGIVDKSSAYLNLDSVPTATQSAKRIRVRHRIQANEDGTFSGGEEITEVQAVPQTVSSVGGGGVFVESASYANQDTPPQAPTSEKRVRVQSDIRANDDGTFSGGYTRQTVQVGVGAGSIDGEGINIRVNARSNADSVTTTYTTNKRDRASLSISPNDDGTVNFVESIQTVQEAGPEEISITGEGITTTVKAAKNLDNPPASFFTAGKRKRHSLSLSANDDGTWDATGSEQTVKTADKNASTGSAGITYNVRAAKNLDSLTLTSNPGKAERLSVSASANDDDTFDVVEIKQTLQKPNDQTSIGSDGIVYDIRTAKNQESLSLSLTPNKKDRLSISASANDDGTFDIVELKQTLKAEDQTSNTGSDGIIYDVYVQSNQESLTLKSNPAKKDRVSISASANDDGTFNVVEVKQKVVETSAEESSITGDGVDVRTKAAKNVLTIPASLYTSGPRKRHSLSVAPNDDGTWDATATEQEVKELLGEEIQIQQGNGIGVKAKVYKNTQNYAPGFQGGPRLRHSISANANDDKTIDYTVLETEVKETAQNSVVGSASQSKKIYYAENIEQSGELSIPGIITNQVINVKDDGTIGYVAVTKDVENPTLMEHTYDSAGSTVEFNAQVGGRVDDLPSLNGDGEAEECDIVLRPDEDGSGSWTAVKTTWKPFDIEAKAGSELFKEVIELGQNKKISEADSVLNVEAASGELIRVSAQIDEKSGKVTYVKSTTTAQEEQWEDEEDDNFIKKTITRKRNAESPEDLGGSTGRTQSQVNEYKKYDTIKEILEISPNLSDFTESRAYQKNERRWVFIQRDFSGNAPSWKELSNGEIRKKNTSRTFTAFGVAYYKRKIDVTETIQYSVNPLNSGASASAPAEGEKEVSVQILPNGLFVKRTTTITIDEWDKNPTIFEDVTFKGGTGTEVESELLENGTTRLNFSETNTFSGAV